MPAGTAAECPWVNGDIAKCAGHSWRLQLLPAEFRQVFKVHQVSLDSARADPHYEVSRRFNVVHRYCWAILRRARGRLGNSATLSLTLVVSSHPPLAYILTALCWPGTFWNKRELKHFSTASCWPLTPLLPSWLENLPKGLLVHGHSQTGNRMDIAGPGMWSRDPRRAQPFAHPTPGVLAQITAPVGCHQRRGGNGFPWAWPWAGVNPPTPGRNSLHHTADPPSHTENSTQSPLNEVGMFQFKGIRSIFKMRWFPSYKVPAQCTARQGWLFPSQLGA